MTAVGTMAFEAAAAAFASIRRRWTTPGDLATALDSRTVRTPALDPTRALVIARTEILDAHRAAAAAGQAANAGLLRGWA